MELTHFSLCSGIGGIDLAAEWAGFKTVGQCEIDEYASRILAKNFKGVKNYGDIRTVTNEALWSGGIDPGKLTVLSSGFPCQPYSLAGKGLGDRDERDLWAEVARVIRELRPRWFVGENTPGLFARDNQRYFDRILSDLSALGYSVSWGMWGACDIGAPHKRNRVFIAAFRDVSDAAFERFGKNAIQSGKPLQGGLEEDMRRVQKSGVQSVGIRSGVPDAAGNELGLQRRAEETKEAAGSRKDNGIRTPEYVGGERWEIEPRVGRVADGISHRLDRLRCLGNAVVPQQVYPIFKAIAEYERVQNK